MTPRPMFHIYNYMYNIHTFFSTLFEKQVRTHIHTHIYIYYMYNNVFKFEGQLSFRHRWTLLALILVTLGKFVVKLLTSNEAVQDITALWPRAIGGVWGGQEMARKITTMGTPWGCF